MKIVKMERREDGDQDWLVTIEVSSAIAGQIGALVDRCVVILDAASLGSVEPIDAEFAEPEGDGDAEFDADEPIDLVWRVSMAGCVVHQVVAKTRDEALIKAAIELGAVTEIGGEVVP